MRWYTAPSAVVGALLLGAILLAPVVVSCSGESDTGGGPFDAGGGGSSCYAGTCDAVVSPWGDAVAGPDESGGATDTGGGAAPDAGGAPGDATPPAPDVPGPGPDVGPPPGFDIVVPPPPDEPDIEVDPAEELWFSYIPLVDVPVVRSVTVANAGTGPLHITAVGLLGGTPPDFQITQMPAPGTTLQPGDSTTIEVTFQEVSSHPGEGTLNIRSDDPDEDPIWIKLKPQPKGDTPTPEPCIQVYPAALNFGRVERGQMGTLTFTITSCGTAALSVREIKRGSIFFLPTPEEFQLGAPVQAPVIIPPGQSRTQAVTFEAGLAGLRSGFFEVLSDDPNEGTVRVDVRGESTAPPPETQGLHLQLDWDSDNCDVDLHLLNPQGTFFQGPNDCYYANMAPNWGVANDFSDDPFLDVDNVWGYGPENINLQEPQAGRYTVIVHFYSDTYEGSWSTDTNATLRVYFYGQLAGTFGPTHLASTDWTWDVCTIDWPSRTVTPLGNVYRR